MKKVLLAILMMGILALQAQEHISVLESNPLLQTKQKQIPKMRTTFALSLPFLDYLVFYLYWIQWIKILYSFFFSTSIDI